MTTEISAREHQRTALLALLEARSVAVVGASARPDSFGARMLAEVAKSPARPAVYPVNPRYGEIDGQRCYPTLADLPGPTDLVLYGIPDLALLGQLSLAAELGCRSGVIFGNAHDLRPRLAAIARSAGMELCGAGCMGFANVTYGLRAMGYIEPDPIPAGPVALVTHSGSVFSALLRTRRAFGFTLAVSSGQELVTAAPGYLEYALSLPETKVLALVLEAIREPARLQAVLGLAAERDVPVVLLTAGNSASGRAMVAAHSGALAGSGAGWEALCRAYGVHRVADLAELCDTMELFCAGRRAGRGGGIATVHDSGLERAHAADVAEEVGVPYGAISESTVARLTSLLDPGLLPTNPLDVWGTGASTRELFGECLTALASDPSVDALALAVDLVKELDGDESYQLAALDVAARTAKPLMLISNVPSALDQEAAALLRHNGIPVLEGMRTGLKAVRHLLDHGAGIYGRPARAPVDPSRQARARELLSSPFELLSLYGIAVTRTSRADSGGEAARAAAKLGYPVVLKTDNPSIAHKSDVGGVKLGIPDEGSLRAAYADLAARLGPSVLVCQTAPPGVELSLGLVRDPDLGPLVVVGAGGTLVELIGDRAVALPPLSCDQARELLAELKVSKLLAGVRGAPPANLDAIAVAIASLSTLATELADDLAALDINPLICSAAGAVAADALIELR
ncbi:MAG TPA: acetate--CoA ligase family protein [Streptosporangiaceae bacterium]|nr:acetate--CoA ligase family protein [Streptosporangiaceae bacterium]